MEATILLLGIVLFIFAAYGDVKSFRIPNMLVAAVALLAVTRLIAIGDPSAALYTVGASVAVLVIGFVLFWLGLCGGGDAKLLAAAVLLVGYHSLFSFLFFMSVCGALVSLAVLVTHWSTRNSTHWVSDQPRPTKLAVPYGVAIATAGGVTLFFQSSVLSSFLG